MAKNTWEQRKQEEAEQKLAEADQLAQQWFAAAPCPDHGGTALTLHMPSGNYNILPTVMHTKYWDSVAVVCGLCGRYTATFVCNTDTLPSYEDLRTQALREWT